MDKEQRKSLMGAYIRQQRKVADLSMRQVSAMVGISNPYLSQIERGLRAPSEAVAAGIATALGVSVDDLYGEGEDESAPESTPSAVLDALEAAEELTAAQKASLAEIYRSFVRANGAEPSSTTPVAGEDTASGNAADTEDEAETAD